MDHETKSASCVRRGCKRPECVERYRTYTRRMMKLWTMGRSTLVDAGPVTAKLKMEQAKGWTAKQQSEQYEIARRQITSFLAGEIHRTNPQTAKVVLTTRLKGVPEGRIPALGTKRRLRSLIRDGHSRAEIAMELFGSASRYHQQWITDISSGYTKLIRGDRAAKVSDLFERWVATPGTNRAAAAQGETRGWPRPMAWDPETMDRPKAKPFSPETQLYPCEGGCGYLIGQRKKVMRMSPYLRDIDKIRPAQAKGLCDTCYRRAAREAKAS